jgi:hypothetical protein
MLFIDSDEFLIIAIGIIMIIIKVPIIYMNK